MSAKDGRDFPRYHGRFGAAASSLRAQYARNSGRAGSVARTYKAFTAGNFRHNLIVRTGLDDAGYHAHHVFVKSRAADFTKAKINIHDPKFGAWWRTPDHQRQWFAYQSRWEEFFRDNRNPTRGEILEAGRKIAKSFGLEVGF